MGTGEGTGRGRGWRSEDELKMGTGSGRAEGRRRSARNRARGVDAMWEMERLEWKETKKKRRQGRVISVPADPDNLENARKQGGKHKVPRAFK